MTMRSKQWYTKTSRLEYSFANSSIGRRPSNRFLTTRSSDRRPVESKFQISLASAQVRFISMYELSMHQHVLDLLICVLIAFRSPPLQAVDCWLTNLITK